MKESRGGEAVHESPLIGGGGLHEDGGGEIFIWGGKECWIRNQGEGVAPGEEQFPSSGEELKN